MKRVQFSIRRSVKFSLLALVLFNFSLWAEAQSYYNGASGTNYNSFPLNDNTTNKVQWIYGPSVFKTAGSSGTVSPKGTITKIYFRLGTTVNSTNTYSNFTISLGQNQGTSTTWSSATFATGLTTVFSRSSFTLTGAAATSWYGITLATPFYYDPSQSLVFELKTTAGTGNTVAQTTTGGNQRNWGGNAATSGTIGSGLVDFGIDIVKASQTDLATVGLTNGLSNTCGNTADPVFVQIRNTGSVDLGSGLNIPVTTVVSGAGSATLNKFFNKALKAGSTDTLHMGNLNTAAITGSINLKTWVSYLPDDSVRSNDTFLTARTYQGSAKAKADFTFTTACDSVRFTNASKDACNAITGYRWDFDNGKTSTAASPRFSYASPGTYNVKLVILFSSGFRDSITKQVIVHPKPQANFSANNQCLGVAIDFSNFSYGVNSYRWSFGDATTSTSTSPSKTYTAAGTYSVKLVATNGNGCRDSITKNVVVYSKPVVSFSVSNACVGNNVSFNNSTTGGSSFLWELGDGSTSSYFNPSKSYSTSGTYGITLTATSAQGCSDNSSRTVTIFALPVSNFSIKDNCRSVPTSFTNSSTGANTYLWTFGDFTSSSSISPAKTYFNPGTYTITLTVTSSNGCNHSSSKTINIFNYPKANFSANDVCIGQETDFSNLSSFPAGGGDYLWRFGNGQTSNLANPSITYSAPGIYDVRLIATSVNGCKDSAIIGVNVFDKPKPVFSASDVCDGKAVQFINNSTGASSMTWEFGDGAKDNTFSPSHTYPGPNTYKVVLTVFNANKCSDKAEVNVTVKPNPVLAFLANDHCFGTDASFTNLSTGASFFTWKFGDGDSVKTTQATHTYKLAGSYTVRLRGLSSNGCSVEQTKAIKVFANPVVNFSATTVCYGGTTVFTNSSSGAASYAWNFGDGSGSSTASNPSYQYFNAGNYKVILTAVSSDNCKQEASRTVTVAALPTPIFLVQDVCTGAPVTPSNVSLGSYTSQKWNFGDGYTDTSKSPVHAYANPGIYKIRLTLTSALGCTDSTEKTILIYTKPIIKVSDSISISKGYTAQLMASGGTDYLWSPAGTLDNPLSPTPVATPDQDTRYTVKVMNAFGCFDTASVMVTLKSDFALEPNNLISPNGNGQNDLWKIKGIEFYPEAKVLIFDQWGRVILEESNYKNTWDGTMKGKALPDGTYFYVISMPGTDRVYKGTVNILKN